MKKTVVFLLLLTLLLLPMAASAAGDLDEILNYTVTAEVNEDATVTLTYHVEWKVLDSSSEGPLSWVTIGIPNSPFRLHQKDQRHLFQRQLRPHRPGPGLLRRRGGRHGLLSGAGLYVPGQ